MTALPNDQLSNPFTLHPPWCPVKSQILQQKIGEKTPFHFGVSLLDNFLNRQLGCFQYHQQTAGPSSAH